MINSPSVICIPGPDCSSPHLTAVLHLAAREIETMPPSGGFPLLSLGRFVLRLTGVIELTSPLQHCRE